VPCGAHNASAGHADTGTGPALSGDCVHHDHAHGCLIQCLSSMGTGLPSAGGHSVGKIRVTSLLFLLL